MSIRNLIFEFDNFLSTKLCDDIIERFENDSNKRACLIYCKDGNHIYDPKRKNGLETIIDFKNEEWSDITSSILDKFIKEVSPNVMQQFCKYFEKYGDNLDTIREIWFGEGGTILVPLPRMQICRTNPDSEFSWHYDVGDQYLKFTALLYLNTIKPENGGATEFLSGYKVQPEAGKLVLFPAAWSNPHRGAFVCETKYVLSCGIVLAIDENARCTSPR